MRRLMGMILLSLIASSVPAVAQSYYYFPHIASGGGWITELYFTNQGTSSVQGIQINFYDNAGASLSVNSNLGSGASTYSLNLDMSASQVIRITPPSVAVSGYAEIIYPSGTNVTATEVYRYKPEGTVLAEVGVSQQKGVGNNYSIPVEVSSSNKLNTAIGLTNPAVVDEAQTVVLTLIKSNGQVQATAAKLLGKGQHFAEYLADSLFPGLDNFTGSLSISCPWGVSALALRQDNEAFGAVATTYGPVLGPFILNSASQNEREPNDTLSSVQAISGSAVVSGTIGIAGDTDLFSFTGKKGDIVSVLCEADSIHSSSSMDSVVYIVNGAGATIAYNDQNGLSHSNDSFLQMVLPADGVYYVGVENYYSSGGSAYIYKLHIKLP
jgi:hypothetical protein